MWNNKQKWQKTLFFNANYSDNNGRVVFFFFGDFDEDEREISSREVQVNANKMSFHKHNLTTGDVRDGMLKTEKKKLF